MLTPRQALSLQFAKGHSLRAKHQALSRSQDVEWLLRQWGAPTEWVDLQLRRAESLGVEFVCWQDADYPALLQQIADPPFVLFAMGKRQLLQQPVKLAVVGARKASGYAQEACRCFVSAISATTVTIVSGMALGVDALAHQTALRSGSPASSIGVLGCGIDRIYPNQNRDLYRQMRQDGLLLSEFPLGAQPLPAHFPQRNRLIAGLSHATLILEASLKSGSLITGQFALDQGRLVFTIPHPLFSENGEGCNALLAEGAEIALEPMKIIKELQTQSGVNLLSGEKPTKDGDASTSLLGGEARHLVQLMESQRLRHVETLAQMSRLPVPTVLVVLNELEQMGRIERLWDGSFSLMRK